MGHAQYCGLPLNGGAVYLEPELVARMLADGPPPPLPAAQPADGTRGSWRSLAEPGTAWTVEGSAWVERKGGEKYAIFAQLGAWAEGAGPEGAIFELHDAGRSLWLRLCADRAAWSTDGTRWHSLGECEWQRAEPDG